MPITAKTYTTDVICLRTYDYGEADKILHLYSPEYGRISAIAKGVKKTKSKMSGACEPLNLSEVQLTKGKNLDVLCQYQPRETYTGLRSDLMKLAYGLLLAEITDQTARGHDMDSRQLFTLLKGSLATLDQAKEADVVPLALECQMALLHALGFHPMLTQCTLTGQHLDLSALFYCFSPELGGVTTSEQKRVYLAQSGHQGHHGHQQWVNVSATTLRILSDPHGAHWSPGQLLKAQRFLQYYFKQVLERTLHAYDLIFNLLEMTPAGPETEAKTLQTPA